MAARKGRPAIGASQQRPPRTAAAATRAAGTDDRSAAAGRSTGGRSTGGRSTGGRTSGARTFGARTSGRGSGRGTLDFTRPALAPSLLAAIVLIACVALVDAPAFVFVRWGVTVLALIVLVFAVRGRTWWAAVVAAAIAVCWNPLVSLPVPGELWAALQLIAAAVFIVIGIVVKVPRATD